MSRSVLLLSVLLLPALPAASRAGQDEPSPILHVSQDESSLERRLGAWLEAQGLKLEYVGEDDDIGLLLRFQGDPEPPFRIFVDTRVSGTAKDSDEVLGRVIILKLWTGVKVPEDRLPAVLAAINAHANRIWAGCFYVNADDTELECQWPLNIPEGGQGIPAILVWDALRKSVASWEALYPEVMKALYA